MADNGTGNHRVSGALSVVGSNWGAGIVLGLCVGVALGVAMGNIGMGIASGAAFFPVFAMVRGRQDDAPGTEQETPDR